MSLMRKQLADRHTDQKCNSPSDIHTSHLRADVGAGGDGTRQSAQNRQYGRDFDMDVVVLIREGVGLRSEPYK